MPRETYSPFNADNIPAAPAAENAETIPAPEDKKQEQNEQKTGDTASGVDSEIAQETEEFLSSPEFVNLPPEEQERIKKEVEVKEESYQENATVIKKEIEKEIDTAYKKLPPSKFVCFLRDLLIAGVIGSSLILGYVKSEKKLPLTKDTKEFINYMLQSAPVVEKVYKLAKFTENERKYISEITSIDDDQGKMMVAEIDAFSDDAIMEVGEREAYLKSATEQPIEIKLEGFGKMPYFAEIIEDLKTILPASFWSNVKGLRASFGFAAGGQRTDSFDHEERMINITPESAFDDRQLANRKPQILSATLHELGHANSPFHNKLLTREEKLQLASLIAKRAYSQDHHRTRYLQVIYDEHGYFDTVTSEYWAELFADYFTGDLEGSEGEEKDAAIMELFMQKMDPSYRKITKEELEKHSPQDQYGADWFRRQYGNMAPVNVLEIRAKLSNMGSELSYEPWGPDDTHSQKWWAKDSRQIRLKKYEEAAKYSLPSFLRHNN